MVKVSVINTGYFKLDGGAMFGIVPKSIWSRINPPDDNNLCTWAMRCLLVEDGDRKILIDTGIGNKQSEKFFSFFQPHGSDDLMTSVTSFIKAEEISDVLITHFHFDHVGGAVSRDEKGNYYPTFPNATYWTNELHYNWAYESNAREAASFLKENFVPLKEMGVLSMIDIEDGIQFSDHMTLRFYHGHTEAMMVPFIHLPSGQTLVYAADLMPSSGHIRMPYVMAYDIRPLVTIKEKAEFYDIICDRNHFLFFEHDRIYETGRVVKNNKGRYAADSLLSLRDQLNIDSSL